MSAHPDELTARPRGGAEPIVAAIGASAGGIQALQALLRALPSDLGVAYVVVVHLAPDHRSQLAAILSGSTSMPVEQVTDTALLRGDHVYVIPPNRRLEASGRTITALPFKEPRGRRAPIDSFFRSLAAEHGDGFGVLLSGGGSDGAVGIKAIKEAGGVILVQEPAEAEHDSMPQAAIATGVVDFVLPVAQLAERLAQLTQVKRQVRAAIEHEVEDPPGRDALARIFARLRSRTGHDFSRYRHGTLLRRLARRMQVTRCSSPADYLALLVESDAEVQALFKEMLISVTTFFRDPEVWEGLARGVLPGLVSRAGGEGRIRAWVPGCATGEEAYSLGILLLEECARQEIRPVIQIFATDLDEAALKVARDGHYPAAVGADLTPERVERFVRPEAGQLVVSKELRECVIFATHNVLSDPPFSRLDLVSCRNLLIYLERAAQQQAIGTFHYALRDGGHLVLGTAETGEESQFAALPGTPHIFRRAPGVTAPRLPLAPAVPAPRPARVAAPPAQSPRSGEHAQALERAAPPSVLVAPDGRVLHLSPSAGRYLHTPGGRPTLDLLDVARPELLPELRAAIDRARGGEDALGAFVPVELDGRPRRVGVLVRPVAGGDADSPLLVVFLEAEIGAEGAPAAHLAPGTGETAEAHGLRDEVLHLRDELRAARDARVATVEELRASNEELQSVNEEYRSAGEQLETSREELQSINEELQTVNQELKLRLHEVSRAHSDLENLMAATEIGTLFLDRELRIARFTPPLAEIFNIRYADRGRPITDLTHRLVYPGLAYDAGQVLQRLVPVEREVRGSDGRWFLSRIRPYRSAEERIDGVVATFVEVTELKRTEEALRASEERFRALLDASAQTVWTTDATGRVLEDSPSWRALTGQTLEQWLDTGWLDAVHPDDREEVRARWFRSVESGEPVDSNFRLLHANSGGWRWTHVRAVPLRDEAGEVRGWVGMNVDIDDRLAAEQAVRASERRFRAIAELVPDLLWESDATATATWHNQRWLRYTGQTAEHAAGEGWLDAVHLEDRLRATRSVRRALLTGASLREEVRIVGADGVPRWFLVRAEPVRVPGATERWFGSATDIHEQRLALEGAERARAEAEQANRAKAEFLAVMSHELRTPLTGVTAYAELLEADVYGPTTLRQRDALSRIKSNSWHLVSIIDEILTLARAEAGKEEIHWEEADAAALVREVTGVLEARAEADGLRLRVEGAEAPLHQMLDANKLRQILLNLIGNAIRYTDEGEVVVRVDLAEEEWLCVHVRDTGPGIAEEERDRVFLPFTQVDSSYSRPRGGTGLGLAISRRLARLIGGDVLLRSEVGEGSTFTLRIPRAPAVEAQRIIGE